ncbi:helix-turn-helix domain-containing protein [Stenotrophomonas sp. CFBP8980]|jgi:transcriptional regulator with XRE-family HTH domain|uniref:helix-turn-helix domain-containing protein n=1 Tax=Stenotrophomonas sp. CFBP8980 TaxID=3096523 RepID=UPI0005AF0CEE|nr:helix-turn-helix transcriptional regulator [Stenotrophomonas sp. CFBP8980]KIP86680.1 transcriptional regulator [Stenotrophomonas maltophilia]MDY1034237.1 helix-turn-helix transcriptional regulator [Stenotrophomonas sp. CFBP8980]
MKVTLKSHEELGPLVRATRKSQGMRQDDTAEGIGVSENFLAKVERGGGTVQWQKLFQVLTEMGIRVEIDVPDTAMAMLQKQVKKRGVPR